MTIGKIDRTLSERDRRFHQPTNADTIVSFRQTIERL